MPLLTIMDEVAADAMWTDANVSVTQQQMIKKYLRHMCGNRVVIPEVMQ